MDYRLRQSVFSNIYNYNYEDITFFYKTYVYECLLNYLSSDNLIVKEDFIYLPLESFKEYNIYYFKNIDCIYKKCEFIDFYYSEKFNIDNKNQYNCLIKLNKNFHIKSNKVLKIDNKDMFNLCKNEFITDILDENYFRFTFHLIFYILQEIIK